MGRGRRVLKDEGMEENFLFLFFVELSWFLGVFLVFILVFV